MASQLQCYPECRATKLHNCMILISILVLTSLSGGICTRLPLEPFGYISIDCGGVGGYNDTVTGLGWVGEKDYLELYDELISQNLTSSSNVTMNDSSSTFRNNVKQLETARIFTFPSVHTKHCYNFNVSLSNNNSTAYLVRAMFPPRNVSGPENFIMAVDTSALPVATVDNEPVTVELLATALDDSMDVCLIPVSSFSKTAAISSLEVRSVPETLYPVFDHGKFDGQNRTVQYKFNYYVTQFRLNFGGDESSPAIRYPVDSYDRLWYAAPRESGLRNTAVSQATIDINTGSEFVVRSMNSSNVSNISTGDDSLQVPPVVWTSAWEGVNLNSTISFSLSIKFGSIHCLSIVLFDVDADKNSNVSRSVNIYNEDLSYESRDQRGPRQWILLDTEVPKTRTDIWTDRAFKFYSDVTTFKIGPGASSALPVMVNTLELYAVVENVSLKTYSSDVSSVQILRTKLPVSGQMFGDPCLPVPWDWIECDLEVRASVAEINLGSSGLQGNLREDFELPRLLTVLDLSNNSLHGTLPRALGTSSNLGPVKLDLSDNNFTGSIPEFGAFHPLEVFNLSSNNISGNLTRFSTNLTSLRILDLSHNSFDGPIPAFPNRSLEVLNLSSNHFSGSINLSSDPNLLGMDLDPHIVPIIYLKYNKSGLQPLRALRLENNNFFGIIPDDIWSSESQLETVDLSNNSFTELNLTTWTLNNFDGRQRVKLLNNKITKVTFGGSEAIHDLESTKDKDMQRLLKSTPGYILLGKNNEWCQRSELSRARVLKAYLCRESEFDDYYYWTLLHDVSSKRTLIISLGVSGSVFLAISCILLVFLRRTWKRMKNLRQIQEELAKEDVRPPFYKYEELRSATKDFSKENELGKGGFGAVYKAELADKNIVAVKLLYPMEQNLTDFLKETVLITGIKHRHLVQLKGCCVRGKKRILVYEFAENGNLAQALWGNGGTFVLNWAQRLKICIGVAKGLSYLHEELQPKIIHRDIKPYNILLDKDWNAKIADFGLARQVEGDAGTQATKFGGTLGYIPPEYGTEGLITEKLDVYSYGIVLLEIISGRKCIDPSAPANELYLRNWAFNLYKEGCISKMAERPLLESVPIEEIESVLKIALACLQENYENRPSMSKVVIMLSGNASDVAIDIVDELRDQQRSVYDSLYQASTVSNVSGTESREDQVLLESISMNHSNSAEVELSLSNFSR